MIGIVLSYPSPLGIQPMLTRQRVLSNIEHFEIIERIKGRV